MLETSLGDLTEAGALGDGYHNVVGTLHSSGVIGGRFVKLLTHATGANSPQPRAWQPLMVGCGGTARNWPAARSACRPAGIEELAPVHVSQPPC